MFHLFTFSLLHLYSSLYLCIYHDALGHHVAEVVHDEEPGVVAGLLWCHAVRAVKECWHAVVALQQIVERGDAVLCLGVDLLTVKTG